MAPAQEPETPASDDVRERMREALERKKAQHHATSAGGPTDDSKSHGGSGPAKAQRTFRRKAGG